jgi:hypothetical protein
MFVLYNKDKKQSQDNHDKAIQIKYREREQKNPGGGDILCIPPNRTWVPSRLLHNGYRVPLLGVK